MDKLGDIRCKCEGSDHLSLLAPVACKNEQYYKLDLQVESMKREILFIPEYSIEKRKTIIGPLVD